MRPLDASPTPINAAARGEPVTITFNGRAYPAWANESVAAALHANGVLRLSRSLKYHRPRGSFCFSGSCAGCYLTIDGRAAEPACLTACRAGLAAHGDGASIDPKRGADLMFPRFIDHHHLFATNPAANRVLREIVRRTPDGIALPDVPREPASPARRVACDVLVVGAGASGLAAATQAASAGRRVILVDENDRPGGRLLDDDRAEAASYLADALLRIRESAASVRLATRVFGRYKEGNIVARDAQGLLSIEASAVIFANGANDEPALIGNNDRPGIIAMRGARRLFYGYAILPGRRPAIVVRDARSVAFARALSASGATLEALIVEDRGAPIEFEQDSDYHAVVYRGYRIARATGFGRVTGLLVRSTDGRETSIDADAIVIDQPPVPAYELAAQAGVAVEFDARAGHFAIVSDEAGQTGSPGMFVAGELAGIDGANVAALGESGERAARSAIEYLATRAGHVEIDE
ncbi:(2Fe-2S)-binding protein [bacterium]|nr:(2Fe-2S)-binding protein [bacterium]